MFMLCTAWPLAPLTRLSSALITINRPVRGSSRQAISTTFVPTTFLVSGKGLPGQQPHKRLAGVSRLVAGRDLLGEGAHFRGAIEAALGPGVKRGQNPAIDRDEVRRELNCHLGARGD